ncbi:MAG: metallophosphoesterase, partial [Candidatus Njordarchaeum guaymaensis]
MIILQVSDLHGHRGMIEKISNKTKEIGADLIIFVGDVTNFGTIEEFKSILLDLSRITNRKIYFVPGNCDPRDALNAKVSEDIVNLHMKIEEDRSLIFGGIGGSNKTPFSTPIELDENEIERILREFSAIDFRRFVLVTHVP